MRNSSFQGTHKRIQVIRNTLPSSLMNPVKIVIFKWNHIEKIFVSLRLHRVGSGNLLLSEICMHDVRVWMKWMPALTYSFSSNLMISLLFSRMDGFEHALIISHSTKKYWRIISRLSNIINVYKLLVKHNVSLENEQFNQWNISVYLLIIICIDFSFTWYPIVMST